MAIGAFLPLGLFVVVVSGVGLRLVALWRRNGERPELYLGAGLLLISCLAVPLTAAGRVPALVFELAGKLCFGAGIFAAAGGVIGVVAFTREVFRPRSTGAAVLLGAAASLAVAAAAWIAWTNYVGSSLDEILPRMRPAAQALMATLVVCFVWSSTESIAYYLPMKRRVALGLADPVVANRFLLWGLAGAANVGLIALIMGCMYREMVILREAAPLSAMAVVGGVMSGAWYLTFFPPRRYEQFIRAAAARARAHRAASQPPD